MNRFKLYRLFAALALAYPMTALASGDGRPNPQDWAGYKSLSELDWEGRSVRRGTFVKGPIERRSNRISIEIKVDFVKRIVRVSAISRHWHKSEGNGGVYINKTMTGTTSLDQWNELIALDAAILPQIAEPILEPDPDLIPSPVFCSFDEYYIEASNHNDEFWRRSSNECDENGEIPAYFDKMVNIAFASFSACNEYSQSENLTLGLFNCVKNWGRSTN